MEKFAERYCADNPSAFRTGQSTLRLVFWAAVQRVCRGAAVPLRVPVVLACCAVNAGSAAAALVCALRMLLLHVLLRCLHSVWPMLRALLRCSAPVNLMLA